MIDIDEYQDRSFGKNSRIILLFMSWFYNVVVYSPRERLMERSELKSVLRALAKVFQIIIVIIINFYFQYLIGHGIQSVYITQ